MSHTYYKHLYHLVWSTKERYPLILPEFQNNLYGYIATVFKSKNCHALNIGGMPDHIHILAAIPPTICVPDIVHDTKLGATKWLRQSFAKANHFGWQEGYGSFTVSSADRNNVAKYIQNQETHHKQFDFRNEFLKLLKENEVDFDEKYLWK